MRILALHQVRHGGLFIDGHAKYFRHRLLAWKTLVFIVEAHLGSQQLDRVFAIRSVHDRKSGREPVPTTKLAQHQVGERMKSASLNLTATVVDQHAGAPK